MEDHGPGWLSPARPRPHAAPLGAFGVVRAARRNLLSIWCEADYTARCIPARLFGRQVVIANSPAAVRHVMVAAHDNYERKSPQMRRALRPLLGDGLFISDGETWKQRRPLVADIMHKSRLPVFGKTMEEAVASLVQRWESQPQAPFDMLAEMAELTANIIARAVFGNQSQIGRLYDVLCALARDEPADMEALDQIAKDFLSEEKLGSGG